MQESNNHIFEHNFSLKKNSLSAITNTKGKVLWFFGPSGTGKSSLASEIQVQLVKNKVYNIIIDGDTIRKGACSDLSFSLEDRYENIRRVAEFVKILVESSSLVSCCLITPLESHRELVKKILGEKVVFVYLETSMDELIKRDPKGLYQLAKQGQIKDFTSYQSPFEPPTKTDLVISTEDHSISECCHAVLNYLKIEGIIDVQQSN